MDSYQDIPSVIIAFLAIVRSYFIDQECPEEFIPGLSLLEL